MIQQGRTKDSFGEPEVVASCTLLGAVEDRMVGGYDGEGAARKPAPQLCGCAGAAYGRRHHKARRLVKVGIPPANISLNSADRLTLAAASTTCQATSNVINTIQHRGIRHGMHSQATGIAGHARGDRLPDDTLPRRLCFHHLSHGTHAALLGATS